MLLWVPAVAGLATKFLKLSEARNEFFAVLFW